MKNKNELLLSLAEQINIFVNTNLNNISIHKFKLLFYFFKLIKSQYRLTDNQSALFYARKILKCVKGAKFAWFDPRFCQHNFIHSLHMIFSIAIPQCMSVSTNSSNLLQHFDFPGWLLVASGENIKRIIRKLNAITVFFLFLKKCCRIWKYT